jgi:hypothetical protein
VQLLKSIGADVTATCDARNVELVRGLGADRVIDYTAEDFTQDKQVYDVVLDAVGKSSFGRCRRLLKPGGTYLSSDLSPLSQNPILPLFTPSSAARRHVSIPRQDKDMARHFKDLIELGAVQAGHRQNVPAGPDCRGLQVRRDRADWQCRHQRCALELVGARVMAATGYVSLPVRSPRGRRAGQSRSG